MIEQQRQQNKISCYQLLTDQWILTEFNLVGMKIKTTDFSDVFKDRMVLTVDNRAPRFLLTPIGEDYLNKLDIFQIDNEHDGKKTMEIETRDIHMKFDGSDKEKSLYDYLIELKFEKNCTFTFHINEENDMLICASTSFKKFYDVILIKTTKKSDPDDTKGGDDYEIEAKRIVILDQKLDKDWLHKILLFKKPDDSIAESQDLGNDDYFD